MEAIHTQEQMPVADQAAVNPLASADAAPLAQVELAQVVSVIERVALDPSVDPARMHQIIDLLERLTAKKAEQEFFADLANMQAEMPIIRKGGEIKHNQKVISSYGRWDEDILPAVRPVLQRHGFCLTFRVNTDEKIKVEAVLSHRAGHSERTSITLPADVSGSKNPVQAVGSSVSYGKRYTAGSLLNLEIHGEDDDGNAAADLQPQQQAGQQQEQAGQQQEQAGLNDIQFNALMKECQQYDPPEKAQAAVMKRYNVRNMAHIPAEQFDGAIKYVRSAIQKQKHTQFNQGLQQ